jgi:hypothetical protein
VTAQDKALRARQVSLRSGIARTANECSTMKDKRLESWQSKKGMAVQSESEKQHSVNLLHDKCKHLPVWKYASQKNEKELSESETLVNYDSNVLFTILSRAKDNFTKPESCLYIAYTFFHFL